MSYDINDFDAEVLSRSESVPVLVDFWAEWCGPCRALGPVLERLAEEEAGSPEPRWVLAKVDTERFGEISSRYGIRSIPNVKLFIDGEVRDEFSGALPEHMIREWLQKALPGKHDAALNHAETLLSEGAVSEAQPLLEDVVASQPENERARVLLARTMLADDPERAEELVSGIFEGSGSFEFVDAIRTIAELSRKVAGTAQLPDGAVRDRYRQAARDLLDGRYDSALEGFIDVIREDRYFDDDGSRRACLAIFRLLGPSHPTTRAYRRSFDGALYV